MNNELGNINEWKKSLGLFPVPLFRDKFSDQKFILLNGGPRGNLCLDLTNEELNSARNYAWSSNVGHYLTIDSSKDKISVFRWDTYQTNQYRITDVLRKINDFYDFLKKQEINYDDSIVKFGLSLFRQIRNLLRDNVGNDSLNSLLYLFACVADGKDDRKLLNTSKWAIKSSIKDFTQSEIHQLDWDNLYSRAVTGLQSKELQPNMDLLLRHASGALFQEAHFETLFPTNYQTILPGFLPQQDQKVIKENNQPQTAHFTPTSVVRTIVEEALSNFSFFEVKEITILDPACGSGEFLKEFIRQFKLLNLSVKVNIIGWDISPSAIDMARFIVNYELTTFGDDLNYTIELKNALSEENTWDIKADFVLMNPPFISWEMMDSNLKADVTRSLGGLKTKRPNTAGVFLWNAVNCLNTRGVIGSVLPTSIFENESYVPLRNAIKDIIDIKIIGRLGSHTLFSDTLVDTALFLGKKTSTFQRTPIVFWSDYKIESAATSLRELRKLTTNTNWSDSNGMGYSIYKSPFLIENENWMPVPFNAYELLKKYTSFTKVKDIFDVRQGARTGLNSVFLVTKNYYETLSKSEKKYFRPAITNDSILNGKLNDDYYIFYAEGAFSITTEEMLKKVAPSFYDDILSKSIEKLKRRAGNIDAYWRLTRHRPWQVELVPKIVSKEFGGAGSFAYDQTGIFIAERSHAWFPKKDRFLGDYGFAYVCILSMPIINDFLTGISKQLGGGNWWYLSSKYINNLPLPDLWDNSKYSKGLICQLADVGRCISEGEKVDKDQLNNLSQIVFNNG